MKPNAGCLCRLRILACRSPLFVRLYPRDPRASAAYGCLGPSSVSSCAKYLCSSIKCHPLVCRKQPMMSSQAVV